MEQSLHIVKQRFGIIGNAKALNHAIEVAIQVAPTAMTVLITGENGSGKESFSKVIHSLSAHKHGKLIAINCGAIPEGTIDSELFGHERGAFTGAIESRKGYFEEAGGGTIFLDEIGEMPLGTQARLLRILEHGEFIRVGSSRVHRVEVRVIAATNVELIQAVERGKFRKDLYYRLSTVPIRVPPLRERGEDILLLFRKFAMDFADRYHVEPIRLAQEAQDELLRHAFPGNIRQLKNLVDQISVLERDRRSITLKRLMHYLPRTSETQLPTLYAPPSMAQGDAVLGHYERDLVYRLLLSLQRDLARVKRLLLDHLGKDVSHDAYVQGTSKSLDSTVQEELAHKSDILDWLPKVGMSGSAEDEVTHQRELSDELSLASMEKILIAKAMKRYHNDKKKVALSLGISERVLDRKVKIYDIRG